MKNLIFALFLILGVSIAVNADTWAVPSARVVCSGNGKYCLNVEPKYLEGQLEYFKSELEKKNDKNGLKKLLKENYCKGTLTANGKKLWKVKLDNEISPVDVLVSDDGDYIVTFDNWHSRGYGDNAVVIYNGANGKLIKRLGLTDFLTDNDIKNLNHSISSINWGGEHKIDYEKKELILNVKIFNVRIDLSNGKVLDEVRDRIPPKPLFMETEK